MSQLTYLAILVACLLGTLPLELRLGVRVYRQWRRLLVTVVPVLVLFGGWDEFAIEHGLWSYDQHYLVGVTLPRHLPLEELLFFVVVPICAVLTYEAVRLRRPDWDVR